MTDTKEKTFLFDPGYAQHTTILSINIDYMYSNLNQYKNFGQKKMQFKFVYSKLIKMVENNVGFCLGSLLWAIYIKAQGDALIEGNPCLGTTYDEAETVEEIDFSIDYFSQLKKDAKYYLNENYEINPLYIKILEIYKKFITQNCGFTSTKSTANLLIPEELIIPEKSEDLEKIYNKIQEVIKSGKLLDLIEVFDLVLKG